MLSSAEFTGGTVITEPTKWKVRVTRPFLYAGQAQPIGAELTVPYAFARELVANNKAERVPDPEPVAEPAAAEPPAPEAAEPAAPKQARKGKPSA